MVLYPDEMNVNVLLAAALRPKYADPIRFPPQEEKRHHVTYVPARAIIGRDMAGSVFEREGCGQGQRVCSISISISAGAYPDH